MRSKKENIKGIILAAKCAPDEKVLSDIQKSGIEAVELFLSDKILKDPEGVIKTCGRFSFKYAIHAPNDSLNISAMKKIVKALDAKIMIFHDIFWEDEWKKIISSLKTIKAKPCIENVLSAVEPYRFMRRYGYGACLDMEHIQFEVNGVFEEIIIGALKLASHVHLTGYSAGSKLWHTHIHHSPEHGNHMLDLIKISGYKGMVVSEAKQSLQTYDEFLALKKYFDAWQSRQ
jgi:sugar phosphate isomerase/epimerase